MTNLRTMAASMAFAAVALAGAILPASAAYVPGPYPGAAPAGSFTQVTVCKTFNAAGGTLVGTDGPVTITVNVPAGAFNVDTQVCIYKGNVAQLQTYIPNPQKIVDAYAVGWTPTGNAAQPLTVTIADTGIHGSASNYLTTNSGVSSGNGAVTPGSFSATFTTDPGFVVAQAASVPAAAPRTGGGALQSSPPVGLLLVGLVLLAGVLALSSRSLRRT